jgi:hypothetical protein
MSELLPEGEDLRRAVKWISASILEHPDQPVQPLVQQAIFKFDISPKDAEFLIAFFKERQEKA